MARGVQAYTYTVTGMGVFPYDMLRYDRAWPADETTTIYIEQRRRPNLAPDHNAEPRSVRLKGLSEPTEGRWESFGWTVTDFKRDFVIEANATAR